MWSKVKYYIISYINYSQLSESNIYTLKWNNSSWGDQFREKMSQILYYCFKLHFFSALASLLIIEYFSQVLPIRIIYLNSAVYFPLQAHEMRKYWKRRHVVIHWFYFSGTTRDTTWPNANANSRILLKMCVRWMTVFSCFMITPNSKREKLDYWIIHLPNIYYR